jgi:hypothetical protein
VAVTRRLLAVETPMLLAGYFVNSNLEGLVAAGILDRTFTERTVKTSCALQPPLAA